MVHGFIPLCAVLCYGQYRSTIVFSTARWVECVINSWDALHSVLAQTWWGPILLLAFLAAQFYTILHVGLDKLADGTKEFVMCLWFAECIASIAWW